jgi:hypothetical protein
MRQIKRWQELQVVYMPGTLIPPLHTSGDNVEDNDVEKAETVPLLLPSGLDSETRKRICLQQVAEHERLLRIAQLQDSLIELRHTRKIRHRMLLNHYMQVAGEGVRANTRSHTVIRSVEDRIAKFVERYRVAYQALLRLDPAGDWQEKYLELKDSDNRGPGKEKDEDGVGDGTYFRSWIWLANPRVPDIADGEVGEEGASEEDVNEVLRVEWTTSFARLERWSEEVELLQEEMRRVVAFLEWKSQDWSAKAEARKGKVALGVQHGLNAYAKKQAAVYHDLAISFAKLWRPTLVSYNLKHSWASEYMTKHGVSLADSSLPGRRARGIFKFRLSNEAQSAVSTVVSEPSNLPVTAATTNNCSILEEASYDEDSDLEESDLEDSDSECEDDWDDDLDW